MNSPVAKWWKPLNGTKNKKVLCTLCPRYCRIGDGQTGFCYIRRNLGGVLYQEGYGTSTGFAVDPIEKKPLNHFLPGSEVLSFGTVGCNLGCKFCQNWNISKSRIDEERSYKKVSAKDVVNIAIQNKCPSIAYTYNDPTIWGEWAIDIAKLARENGLKNVMVTAGYITKQARKEIYTWMDAANIDLKAFSETFYHKLTYSHLDDILDTIKWLYTETDVWLEVTNLIIPGYNDNTDEYRQIVEWLLKNCADTIPLHFTAFHPDFKMKDIPPTPYATLNTARNIALAMGMKYVYTGNVYNPDGQTTFCPQCGAPVIIRHGYLINVDNIDGNTCKNCASAIDGVFG